MKKKKLRTYYVELRNHTDRRDDEAVKVKASSPQAAARIAGDYQSWRFSVGRVFPARGAAKRDKQTVAYYRFLCGRGEAITE